MGTDGETAHAAGTGRPPFRYLDEMNFAEFPLAALADTAPAGQKTLEFADQIDDPSTGRTVARTLVVTAADRFGLPTALDDEVLLGLLQLTARAGFADRKVHFSRYGLIKLLGWRDESKSYKRVEESLNRWAGTTLQYRKAWWSKAERCWVTETLHVLDQVTVFDRERLARRRAAGSGELALSSFVWNQTVFDSFKAGYLKALDFGFYTSLGSAVAKRVYRFLDKRFYHTGRWEFDLRAFACAHVGLSAAAPNAELKRKLRPAIRELEGRGYLAPLPDAARFVKAGRGGWRAVFVRATAPARATARTPDEPLVGELVARGLSERAARRLVDRYPAARVAGNLRLADRQARAAGGAIRNRAGWLYAAVVHDYAARADPGPPVGRPADRPSPASPSPGPTAPPPSEAEAAFDHFWAGLPEEGRAAFEREAVAAARPFHRRHYEGGAVARGALWAAARRRLLIDPFERVRPGSDRPNPARGGEGRRLAMAARGRGQWRDGGGGDRCSG
ncbi:MAG: replication initiator protein A [Gemmataceae bacterium]